MQRDFNILFMPVFFMSLIILIVRPLITKLAILWNKKEYKEFSLIIKRLLGFLSLGGLFVTFIAYLFGVPVLSLIFGVNLNKYVLPFTILIFSGVLYALAIVFENILTIIRKQHLLVGLYIILLILTKLITEPFIYQKGMLGAAISFFIVMLVYVIGNGSMYLIAIHRKRMKNE